jgi:hypothetical protein
VEETFFYVQIRILSVGVLQIAFCYSSVHNSAETRMGKNQRFNKVPGGKFRAI